jgi:general stress protein YciG
MSRRPNTTAHKREQILVAYAGGRSYREVAAKLDLDVGLVGRVVRAAGQSRTASAWMRDYNAHCDTPEGRAQRVAAGRKGGTRCRERHGLEHYARAGRKGGTTTLARHGKAHYAKLGHTGGSKTAATHGRAFYEEIGRLGGGKVREMCARARALEETG